MSRATTTPEAAPTSSEKDTAPKPAGFEEFFNQVGDRREVLLRNRIDAAELAVVSHRTNNNLHTLTPAQLASERKTITTEQASAIGDQMALYGKLANHLTSVAHAINPRISPTAPGGEFAAVNRALPGIESAVRIAHNNIENGDEPTDEQNEFFEAMGYRAEAELQRREPPVITRQDFVDNPYVDAAGAPLTYEQMEIDSIDAIRQQLTASEAQARSDMDDTTADRIAQDLVDLDEYSNAFSAAALPRAPRYRKNPLAAQEYAELILTAGYTAPTPPATDPELDEMQRQANIDRVFTKFDGLVKNTMKTNLDELDNRELATLRSDVEAAQNLLVSTDARNLQKIVSPSSPSPNRAAYDALSARLGAQELRVAQRIGMPDASGNLAKVPRTAAEVNLFLATQHSARSTALSTKVVRHLAEHRTFGDHVASRWAGLDGHGKKETRAWVNATRKILKVGMFATAAVAGGPAGIVGAASFFAGAKVWSKNTVSHNHELQTHPLDSFANIDRLVQLMRNPGFNTTALKLQEAQRVEREGRRNNETKQTRRRQKELLGAAAVSGAVALSPYWVPIAGNLIGGAAATAWTGGSSFIAAHPNSLWTVPVAASIYYASKPKKEGGHH